MVIVEDVATPKNDEQSPESLNAMLALADLSDPEQLSRAMDAEKQAVHNYFRQRINPNTVFFHTLEEKLNYLVDEGYWEEEIRDNYDFPFIKKLFKSVYDHKFRFPTLMGAIKFYGSYALKTRDGDRYLERYEDRLVIVALYLAKGNKKVASAIAEELVTGRYQPATPTFLNAGKKNSGELVSCHLLDIQDNMESIGRAVNSSLQLSKLGGGVGLNLSNLRESGAPIRGRENMSSGLLPIMKILDDSFRYANQLGARQGAGAVYISTHHPDVVDALDTKRENADENLRIKTLSVGLVVPDIDFELLRNDDELYMFSPYDVAREYPGETLSTIDITKHYYDMVANPNIKKRKIKARQLYTYIAEVQMESGYPYLLFIDHARKANPLEDFASVQMSNLCSEILQSQTPSELRPDLSYKKAGLDVSCNLGSVNIAKLVQGEDLAGSIETAMRALTAVSDRSNFRSVPSIQHANREMHSVGLGAMNLHGALTEAGIKYSSQEAREYASSLFAAINYYSILASMKIAKERRSTFLGWEESTYKSGVYFDKYLENDYLPKSPSVKKALKGIKFPTKEDWSKLKSDVQKNGIYHAYRMAIPPTGSISYLASATPSTWPVSSAVEIRKEGKTGRVYCPAYALSPKTVDFYFYEETTYGLDYKAIIDMAAVITEHIDQGMSLNVWLPAGTTTTKLNKIQVYAHRKGLKTLYYTRIEASIMNGQLEAWQRKKKQEESKETHSEESVECEACML